MSRKSQKNKAKQPLKTKDIKSSANQKLRENLQASGLLETAEEVDDGMYRMQWGSATVICTVRGTALVAIAPMFKTLPAKNKDSFCQKILSLNAEMGGTAAFAIQSNGSVVLQCGRAMDGLDPQELKLLLSTVGKFADDYDDILDAEFYH